MSCTLTVSGKRFPVDRFLAATGMHPDEVRRAKCPVDPDRPERGLFETSGFTLEINSGFGPLEGQVRDAVRFLRRPAVRQLLSRLRDYRGVEVKTLDFGIAWLDVAAQFDYLPENLISLAGEFGLSIVVSHYMPLETRAARRQARKPDGKSWPHATSDGIDAEDWSRVHARAVRVAAARTHMSSERARVALLTLLRQLQRKYGPRPSILATRADYVRSRGVAERALLDAFALATRRKDRFNLKEIALSLAARTAGW